MLKFKKGKQNQRVFRDASDGKIFTLSANYDHPDIRWKHVKMMISEQTKIPIDRIKPTVYAGKFLDDEDKADKWKGGKPILIRFQ